MLTCSHCKHYNVNQTVRRKCHKAQYQHRQKYMQPFPNSGKGAPAGLRLQEFALSQSQITARRALYHQLHHLKSTPLPCLPQVSAVRIRLPSFDSNSIHIIFQPPSEPANHQQCARLGSSDLPSCTKHPARRRTLDTCGLLRSSTPIRGESDKLSFNCDDVTIFLTALRLFVLQFRVHFSCRCSFPVKAQRAVWAFVGE